MRIIFAILILFAALETAFSLFGKNNGGGPPTRYSVTWLPSKEGRACANAAVVEPGSKDQTKWCKQCTQEVRIGSNNGPISFYPDLGGCGLASKKPALKKNETFIHRELDYSGEETASLSQSDAYPLSVAPTLTLSGEEARFFTKVSTPLIETVNLTTGNTETGNLDVNGNANIDASLTLPCKS